MTQTGRLSHGMLLIQHRRFGEAEQALRQELVEAPQNAQAHALLALALMGQDRDREALDEAHQSIGLAPSYSFAHYIRALVLHHLDRENEALAAIEEAIRLDPEDADYFSVLARIYMAKEDWTRALEAARTGRQLDSENVNCANLEAMALVNLGRKDEADQAMAATLEKDPENAMSHANQGWTSLHRGDHQQALIHFREALRLNPQMEWARRGIVESMKARNPIYKVMLGYFLWMERLSGRTRWAVIIGIYVLFRFFRNTAASNPALRPFLLPVIVLYMGFALMTWIARPLFNLLLRLDPFGRMALSEEEIVASNWLGACIVGALALLAAGLGFGSETLLLGSVGLLGMTLPVAGMFQGHTQKSRRILVAYTAGLFLAGALFLGMMLLNVPGADLWGTVFIFGWVLYSWIANAIMRM